MFFNLAKKKRDLNFEDFLSDGWVYDLGVAEAPLDRRVVMYLGVIAVLIGLVVLGRIFLLAGDFSFYRARAEANLNRIQKIAAPRGIITDTFGKALVENKPVFLAFLNLSEFFRHPEYEDQTLSLVSGDLGVSEEDFWALVSENNEGIFSNSVLLSKDLNQEQFVKLQSLELPTIEVVRGFGRSYLDGPVFSSVLGYTGVVSKEDLNKYPELGGSDFVGKTGIEGYYEEFLRGVPGVSVRVQDALGKVLDEREEQEPKIGGEIRLSIDAELQSYFYNRLRAGLKSLGRTTGVGLAMDPRDGRVLALVNLPSFDNNLFNLESNRDELGKVLNSPYKPLFNRAISGAYTPGSTIKPLHAVAALAENIIDVDREIFSPGYLDVPNPYNPDKPSRFVDWRYQGRVNLRSAIAQSSNVYFYLVGGGAPYGNYKDDKYLARGIEGLGVVRLNDWWGRFGLGSVSGIDLPGEGEGFLPSIESKEERTGLPWLLGDTYNVSIGQGDLLVTPLQILNYISAIANGGKLYKPFLAENMQEVEIIDDLSYLSDEIKEVQEGMRMSVTSPMGTSHILDDLPFTVAGKTGSAQTKNNAEVNAFFVGYAPAGTDEVGNKTGGEPEIAILVLVENAKEGSLNAVPIAKDVLNWYYQNRIK